MRPSLSSENRLLGGALKSSPCLTATGTYDNVNGYATRL